MALIHENKVPIAYREAFINKVRQVAFNLNVNPNWLMVIMNFESAGSFSPSRWGGKNKSYVGLIQFGNLAAKEMKTTTKALSQMSAVQQLDYVEIYYKKWYKMLKMKFPKSFVDFYLITLFPSKANKGHNAVIESRGIPAKSFAKVNPKFRTNARGGVTVGEVHRVLISELPAEWRSEFV